MKTKSIKHALILLLPALTIGAEAITYVVQKNDTLSLIAKKHLGNPVYSKNGSLQKLLEFNPDIKNKHKIRPGQTINISDSPRSIASETVLPEPMDAPVVPMEAQAAPVVVAQEESDPISHIKASLGYDYYRIDAVDISSKDKATILSEAPRVALTWDLAWSKEWSTQFQITYRKEKVTQPTNSTRTLDKTSFSRTQSLMGLTRHWDNSNTQFFVARSQRGFLKNKSTTQLQFDSAASIDIGLNHEIAIVKRKSATAGLAVQAAYLGAAQGPGYTSESGYSGQGAVFMRHKTKNYLIEARASYGLVKQNTSFVEQQIQEIGTSLSVGWEFN